MFVLAADFQSALPLWFVFAAVPCVMALMMMLMVTVFVRFFKRCPPNRIMVVYGKAGRGEAAQCVHGGARLIIPMLQDCAWLTLEPIRIEVSRQTTSSGKVISDPIPRVFSVAIGTTPELMQSAAVRLLGLGVEAITQQAEDIIVKELDTLLDAVEHGKVEPGTEEFHELLESSVGRQLEPLGLVLINFRRE